MGRGVAMSTPSACAADKHAASGSLPPAPPRIPCAATPPDCDPAHLLPQAVRQGRAAARSLHVRDHALLPVTKGEADKQLVVGAARDDAGLAAALEGGGVGHGWSRVLHRAAAGQARTRCSYLQLAAGADRLESHLVT